MRKNDLLLIATLSAVMAFSAACSPKNAAVPSAPSTTAGQSDHDPLNQSSSSEQSVLTGTIDEKKDFMFLVTDADGNTYALPVGDPIKNDLEIIKTGDNVDITYEGELSLTNTFEGKILSIKKIN